ncbi:hypothetical protein I3843_07G231500 [Carya illinoinensis]|uniref:Uncharacterized protein n=1 Tax=Carya illinoinensis TaxID=32201 RepID=A0A922EMV4_CARIL|nr:hypothetical protein I3842_07G238400 [Carya illinoinensis]KAG7973496.1 hypothetical protein I3843_07G231500 [Carya illinoinensis]
MLRSVTLKVVSEESWPHIVRQAQALRRVRAFSATMLPPSKAIVYDHQSPPDSVTRSTSCKH